MDSLEKTKKLDATNKEDLELLIDLTEKGSTWEIRKTAIEKLDSKKHPELFARVANNDFGIVRQTAISKLNTEKHNELLIKISKEDIYIEIRKIAIEILKTGKQT